MRKFIAVCSFFLFLFSVITCTRTPVNPYDPVAVEEGYVTPAPIFDLEEGVFHKNIEVGLSCPEDDAVIYYTIDGTEPGVDSAVYEGLIPVTGDDSEVLLQAVAKCEDKALSGISAVSYSIEYLEIEVSVLGNGSVSPEGIQRVSQDGSLEVEAFAEPEFGFSSWTVEDGTGIDIEDIYALRTFVSPTIEGGHIRANFETGIELTITDDGNGTTDPADTAIVVLDVPRTITAVPDFGYVFSGWTRVGGGDVSFEDHTSPTTRITLTNSPADIRAEFELDVYDLIVSATTGGTVTPLESVAVNHGVSTAVSASPSAGYMFNRWNVVSGTGVTITDQEDMTTDIILEGGDAEIQAEFLILRNLIVNNDGNGTTVPSGSEQVGDGLSRTISASPSTGYGFSHWTATGSAVVADADSPSTSVTLTGGDGTVTANFSNNEYTLRVESDVNGTATPDGQVTVIHGEFTNISAEPVTGGYEFSSWTVTDGTALIADSGSADTTIRLLSGDASVRANFIIKTYTLTISDNGFGATDPAVSLSATHGEEYSITATADSGYVFDYWRIVSGTVNISDSSAASTLVLLDSGDAAVEAVFTPMVYNLTISDDGNGTTDPAGSVPVAHAAERTISAFADSYFIFSTWSVENGTGVTFDGDDQSQNPAIVTLTAGNAEIKANFLPTYTLTVSNDGNGTTTPVNPETVVQGVETAISATPGIGYDFSHWSSPDSGVSFEDAGSASTLVTLSSGDAEVTANFQLSQYTLTIENNVNCTTDPSGAVTAVHGIATDIEAVINPGCIFEYWEVTSGSGCEFGDELSGTTTATLTEGDVTIRAVSKVDGWANTYKASVDGILSFDCIVEAPDDEYIAVGQIRESVSDYSDLWICKIDSNGNILWEKSFGDPEQSVTDTGHFIKKTADSNYLVGGKFHEYSESPMLRDNAWLIKIDDDGQVLWQKRYRIGYSRVDKIEEDSSGNLYIGIYESLSPASYFIKKLNSSGVEQWTRLDNGGRDFTMAEDGGCFIISIQDDSGTDVHVVTKLDSSGAVSQQTTYDNFGGIYDFQETDDGGFIISSQEGVVKMDSSGTIEWQKKYTAPYTIYVRKIEEISGGGYIASGKIQSAGSLYQGHLLRLDSSGNVIWSKQYGGSGDETVNSLTQIEAGGYIVGGWSDGYESETYYRGWILKTDEEGLCGGYEESFTTNFTVTTLNQRSSFSYSLSEPSNLEANTTISGVDTSVAVEKQSP